MIGSHIDTVKDGGRFDGNLGVVAGILAVQALRDAGISPALPGGGDRLSATRKMSAFPTHLSTSESAGRRL